MNQQSAEGQRHVCTVPKDEHFCSEPCALRSCGGCAEGNLCKRRFVDKHQIHLCGNSHSCPDVCTQPGICLVTSSQREEVPAGAKEISPGVGAFRLPCQVQVPANNMSHNKDKSHSCKSRTHRCDYQCARCFKEGNAVFCTQKVNHGALARQDASLGGYIGEGRKLQGTSGVAGFFELSPNHHFPCEHHLCEKPCSVVCRNSKKCSKPCTRRLTEHQGKSCLCDGTHPCGKLCCADDCIGFCVKDVVQRKHRDDQCRCSLDECLRRCDLCSTKCSKGHGHKKSNNKDSLKHDCGHAHTCKGWCGARGVCHTYLEEKSRPSDSKVRKFKDSVNAVKARCTITIEKGMNKHPGSCKCAVAPEDHTCEEICPTCLHSCQKKLREKELPHRISHGKIHPGRRINWVVVPGSDIDKISVTLVEENYQQMKKTCDQVCEDAGRGHVHVRRCPAWRHSACPEKEGERLHEGSLELVAHTVYWSEETPFPDPCRDADEKEKLCSVPCPKLKSVDSQSDKNYCMLPVPHKKTKNREGNPFCFHDGHWFHCKHTCGNLCRFANLSNHCHSDGEKMCKQIHGHVEGCKCMATSHPCKEKCRAPQCSAPCVRTCEQHEEVDGKTHAFWKHECSSTHCSSPCYQEPHGCVETCSLGHHHDPSGKSKHHCANHNPADENRKCTALCEQPGQCQPLRAGNLTAEQQLKVYQVKVRDRQTSLSKNSCSVNHWFNRGPSFGRRRHACSVPAEEHGCPDSCQLCGFYCTKTVGHEGQHKLVHGLVPKGQCDDVRYGNEGFPAVVLQETTRCSRVCKVAGRGHLHRVKCPGVHECLHLRHTRPGSRVHRDDNWDYVSHETFMANFEDQDRVAEYALCGALCHRDQPTSCDQPVLHHNILEVPSWSSSLASLLRGHHFPECPHPCRAQCGKCESPVDGAIDRKPCFLRFGHDHSDQTKKSTCDEHLCQEHCLGYCPLKCPLCRVHCNGKYHYDESTPGHSCDHQLLTEEAATALASKERILERVGTFSVTWKPVASDILVNKTCLEICGEQYRYSRRCGGGADCYVNVVGKGVEHFEQRGHSARDLIDFGTMWKLHHWRDPLLHTT